MKLKVLSNGNAYFPRDLREKGYVGEVEYQVGVHTAILEQPGATLKQIIKSLQNQLQAYRIRTQQEENR